MKITKKRKANPEEAKCMDDVDECELHQTEDIEKKLRSYLHHAEYELNPIGTKKIADLIKQKKTVYNLKVDSRSNKFKEGNLLEKLEMNLLVS